MATASGPEPGDPPAGGPRFREDDHVPAPRRRVSPVRLLAMVALSVIVSALVFRVVVEAVRWALEP